MGSGYRTFTAGEVLTASNVQNYLQDQAVMVFGGSAARSSAIGTANFEEGMTSYLTDTDKLEVYNGTNWVSVAPTSTQGLTLINTTSFSAVASQSINDVFSASYENYRINLDFIGSTNNGVSMRLRVGGADSSSTDYKRQYIYATNTLLSAGRGTTNTSWPLAGNNGTDRSLNTIDVFGAFLSRVTIASCFSGNNLSGTPENVIEGFGHNLATSYTGFTLIASAGTITGKVSVYGYNS